MSTDLLTRLLNTKHWKWSVTAFCFLLVMICATPYFHYMPDLFQQPYWETVMQQVHSDGIYQPDGTGENVYNHQSKKTFRLTVPLIARLLHLNAWGIYIMQFMLGIVFIYLMLDFIFKKFGDKKLAFWFVLACTSVYFGIACFTDIYSYFSGWAFLFLFLAVYFKNPFLIFLASLLAAWTDERGLMALGYVILFWQYSRYGTDAWWRKISAQSVAVVAAILLYLSLRVALQMNGYYVGMHRIDSYLYDSFEIMQFGAWTIFEGLWILILYKFYVLYLDKRYSWLIINLLVMLGMIASSMIVRDVTRSGSFILIEVFLSALIIYNHRGLPTLNRYVFFSAVACLLFPSYYVITDSGPIILQRSIITYFLKTVYGHLFL